MTKDELEDFKKMLEMDRRRGDSCPKSGFVVTACILLLFLITCGMLYAGGDRICYECGAFYDTGQHAECPACYPNLAGV